MIWQWLLYGVAQANEWGWSIFADLPLDFLDATYEMAQSVHDMMQGSVGLDIFPIEGAVLWVRLIFWSFGLALTLRAVSKVLGIVFGSRNPSQ